MERLRSGVRNLRKEEKREEGGGRRTEEEKLRQKGGGARRNKEEGKKEEKNVFTFTCHNDYNIVQHKKGPQGKRSKAVIHVVLLLAREAVFTVQWCGQQRLLGTEACGCHVTVRTLSVRRPCEELQNKTRRHYNL